MPSITTDSQDIMLEVTKRTSQANMKAELMIEKKSSVAASHSDQSATQGAANKVGKI